VLLGHLPQGPRNLHSWCLFGVRDVVQIKFSADGRPQQQIKRRVGCHNASFIQLHSYFVGRLEPPFTLATEISHCVKILVLHKSVKNHGLVNKPVIVGIDAVGRAAIAAVWCIRRKQQVGHPFCNWPTEKLFHRLLLSSRTKDLFFWHNICPVFEESSA
jgi:hypothetical protein